MLNAGKRLKKTLKVEESISCLGSIAIIKINVLCKVNKLFQMASIIISEIVLHRWQESISNFIWSVTTVKQTSVKQKFLQDSKEISILFSSRPNHLLHNKYLNIMYALPSSHLFDVINEKAK